MTNVAHQSFVREVRVTYIGAKGATRHGVEYCHSSRQCTNCTHYGPHDAQWVAEGCVEEFGSCMNLCGAADAEDEQQRFCSSHQTRAEFDADVQRPHRPVLELVATTE